MNSNRAATIDTATNATYSQTSTKQTCPLCRCEVKMDWHMWVKMNGAIAHDYCVRVAGFR